jgi:hypothetical protein
MQTFQAKKIYRLKEDQAISLSLELGRREKVVRRPSADFLPPSPSPPHPPSPHMFMTDSRRGWCQDFVDTIIVVKKILVLFLFKKPFSLIFKGIVLRDSILSIL